MAVPVQLGSEHFRLFLDSAALLVYCEHVRNGSVQIPSIGIVLL
jgi:hypothetical protein